MQTVVGILTDQIGHAADGQGGFWATPSASISRTQADEILIDQSHDGQWVGEVAYLELRDGNLWCVGVVDDSVVQAVDVRVADETIQLPHDLYWSARRVGGDDYGIQLLDVAITPTPARVYAKPLTFLPGGIDYRQVATERWHLRGSDRELLTRAAHSYLDRRKAGGGNIQVHDEAEAARWRRLEGRRANTAEAFAYLEDQHERWKNDSRPTGPIEYRPSRIVGVS